jgi:hypothetical protein
LPLRLPDADTGAAAIGIGPPTLGIVETTTTGPVSTLVGPNGTAPGMNFVEQMELPRDDSSPGRATGAPLALAAILMLTIFVTILIRARRARRATSQG